MLACVIAFGVGAFAWPGEASAFSACQCACLDTANIQTFLRPVPAAPNTCQTACSVANVCPEDSTLSSAYERVTASGERRCACECATQGRVYEYRKVSSGISNCTDSCESTCRSAGMQVDPEQIQTTNIRQIDCLTDADCTVGDFRYFKGIHCSFEPTSDRQNFPTGDRPTCIIPVTRENADVECQRFGGIASGGGSSCSFIGSGDRPQSYLISRPYITEAGGYGSTPYANYTTPRDLWRALELSPAAPAGGRPGLCYTFGASEGDVTEISLSEIVEGTNTQNRYACIKSRQSLCGSVDPPTGTYPYNKNRSEYSCVPTPTGTPLNEICFPTNPSLVLGSDAQGESITVADLCTTANTQCCTRTTCRNDQDCGAFKRCNDDGRCVSNPICDPENPTFRCRTASEAERANSDMCTISTAQTSFTVDPMLTPYVTDRADYQNVRGACPIQGYSCCSPVSATALGTCAADKMNEVPNWQNFTCMGIEDLPGGVVRDVRDNGPCILEDVYATVASPNGPPTTRPRCGNGKYCCNAEAVGYDNLINEERSDAYEGCGTYESQFSCTPMNSMVDADEDVILSMGYLSRDSYYAALASSPYCEITTLFGGSWNRTRECIDGYFCCDREIFRTRTSCMDDTSCPAGTLCDLQVHICVPGAALEQRLSSESCADRAQAAGDPTVEFIAAARNNADMSTFTCQRFADPNDTAIGTNCLRKGCEVEGEGSYCCAPGTGLSPAAVTSTGVIGQVAAPTAPFSLALPACIQSGDCHLSDIVQTGVNFANFLLAICGAVFLGIIVWAGIKFLSAGSQDATKNAMGMIKNAVYGLIFMFAGFIIINFLQSMFIASSVGETPSGACEALSTSETTMACQQLSVDPNDASALSEEMTKLGCVTGKCPGPKNYVCCPQ